MIALPSCPSKNYFDVEELWFRYKERNEYKTKGLIEGARVFVSEKTEKYLVIETEVMPVKLTYEEAYNVYGSIYIKKSKF